MERSNRSRLYLLLAAGLIAIVLLAIMVRLDRPLRTTMAPQGIVSFELAGSREAVTRILASWGPEGHRNATLSLRLDYVFLIAYAAVISILCTIVANAWAADRPRLWCTGMLLAGGQWLAALLDAAENLLLQNILAGATAASLPQMARWCALTKFALIACGWLYILLAGGIRMVCHFRSPKGRWGH